jgi:putative ABC transport system substrate-binding protein
MSKRRKLIVALGAVALVAPFGVFAQPSSKVWRIGSLSLTSGMTETLAAFVDGLRSLGYIEGRNLLIEYRWADGNNERLPEMTAELVRLKVDVIVAGATSPVAAAKLATSTIPIVMPAPNDPLGSGLVASLARPGGNVTGMSMESTDLAGKHLQLVRELAPKTARVAVLTQTGRPGELFIEQIQATAKSMGVSVVTHQLRQADELAGVFAAMQRERVQALIVPRNTFSFANRERILALAAQYRLPALYGSRDLLEASGLMSYGPSLPAMYRHAASYVDRIFGGRETRRPAGGTAHQVRDGGQPQNRQNAGPYHSASGAAAGR